MVLATRSLSGRELEVLRHAAGGNSNKRIALKLDISEETVKAHMKSILSKLGQ
jgi:two-component system NarL family response regulator